MMKTLLSLKTRIIIKLINNTCLVSFPGNNPDVGKEVATRDYASFRVYTPIPTEIQMKV